MRMRRVSLIRVRLVRHEVPDLRRASLQGTHDQVFEVREDRLRFLHSKGRRVPFEEGLLQRLLVARRLG